MATAEDVVLEDFVGHFNADVFPIHRELTSELPTIATKSANRIAERAEDEDVPLDQVIALLAQAREDPRHALHAAITRSTKNGWTNPDWAWRLFQQLADGIIAQLKAS
ncbi:MAG: hypothetical protein ACM31C_12550 [Acidobacteriota bacterium]